MSDPDSVQKALPQLHQPDSADIVSFFPLNSVEKQSTNQNSSICCFSCRVVQMLSPLLFARTKLS